MHEIKCSRIEAYLGSISYRLLFFHIVYKGLFIFSIQMIGAVAYISDS